MRIIIGVHHFPPTYRGGAEWRAYRTAHALRQNGHQASVISIERVDAEQATLLSYQDDVFRGVPVRRLAFNLAAAPEPLRWEYDNEWLGEHLYNTFKEERPDLFHLIGGYLQTGSSLEAAHRVGIPTVVTLTDFWFLCRRFSMMRTDGAISTLPIDPLRCARCLGEEKRRFRWLGRVAPSLMNLYWRRQHTYVNYFDQRYAYLQAVMAQVDLAICPSRLIQQMYTEAQMLPKYSCFLRQGHTFQHLTPEELTKRPSPLLRVGYLGQIAHLKGVHVLLDAVHALPRLPIELRVFGDLSVYPDYVSGLQRRSKADPRIKLEGPYDHVRLTAILQDLDVIVVPSLWYENSPNVILEAFAHHTPVIASDFGGMAELIQHNANGLLFTLGDVGDLQRMLCRLVQEPGLLSLLKAGAAQSIPPTVDDEMRTLMTLYGEVLERRRSDHERRPHP